MLKNNQRGFAHLLALVLVALIGAAVFIAYHNYQTIQAKPAPRPSHAARLQTPNPAVYAGWKTYTTKYGVSFRYPADWYVTDETSIIQVTSVPDPVHNYKDPKYAHNLYLHIYTPYRPTQESNESPIGELLPGGINIGNKNYCLLATRDTVANATSSIGVQDCKPSDKHTWLHTITYKGESFPIVIDSRPTSTGDSSVNPIALDNLDVATMKLIIESVQL